MSVCTSRTWSTPESGSGRVRDMGCYLIDSCLRFSCKRKSYLYLYMLAMV